MEVEESAYVSQKLFLPKTGGQHGDSSDHFDHSFFLRWASVLALAHLAHRSLFHARRAWY